MVVAWRDGEGLGRMAMGWPSVRCGEEEPDRGRRLAAGGRWAF